MPGTESLMFIGVFPSGGVAERPNAAIFDLQASVARSLHAPRSDTRATSERQPQSRGEVKDTYEQIDVEAAELKAGAASTESAESHPIRSSR